MITSSSFRISPAPSWGEWEVREEEEEGILTVVLQVDSGDLQFSGVPLTSILSRLARGGFRGGQRPTGQAA
jgi:hypothetical protein